MHTQCKHTNTLLKNHTYARYFCKKCFHTVGGLTREHYFVRIGLFIVCIGLFCKSLFICRGLFCCRNMPTRISFRTMRSFCRSLFVG